MPLYLSLLIFSAIIPLFLSFDRKVRFYRVWKVLFPSVFMVAPVYITADIFFVKHGIWGFNPAYHTGIVLAGLPLEEWLFFILIPYSCVFIHYVVVYYYPNLVAGNYFVRVFTVILITGLIIVVIFNADKAYTTFNFCLMIMVLILALFDKSRLLNRYLYSFLFILIPFFVVNSILTGTFIKGEVVWYNNQEILGIRILTVPVEDIGYAFSLILINLLVINKLRKFLIFRE